MAHQATQGTRLLGLRLAACVVEHSSIPAHRTDEGFGLVLGVSVSTLVHGALRYFVASKSQIARRL